jgi:PBSX family phage portal protein
MDNEKTGSAKDQSRVLIWTSKGKAVPFSRATQLKVAKSSKQLTSRELGSLGLVARPYDPSKFLEVVESNVYADRCVRQTAQDATGTDWNIIKEVDKDESPAEQKILNEFLYNANSEGESLLDVFEKAIIDLKSIGWMTLEVAPRPGGLLEVYHVPAHTIYVHKNKEKFCQIRDIRRAWFKRFGSKDDITRSSGELIKASTPPDDIADSMIYYRSYYPKSDYYGVPPFIGALGSILGLIAARDYNLSFFQNYGMPLGFIILQGDWEENSDQALKTYLTAEHGGVVNANKAAVIKVASGSSLQWIPISAEAKEGQFRVYIKMLRDEVLSAYAMPPYRIGIAETGALGGSTAIESTKIYYQSVIRPLQRVIETITGQLIKAMGISSYYVELMPADVRNLESVAEIYGRFIDRGVMSPNEVRDKLDLGDPYPGGDSHYISASFLPVDAPVEKEAETSDSESEPAISGGDGADDIEILLEIRDKLKALSEPAAGG